jgi:hypothetical protein
MLRVFKEGAGAEREKVTADWRKVLNEELHNLCCSPDGLGYQFNEDGGARMWHVVGRRKYMHEVGGEI